MSTDVSDNYIELEYASEPIHAAQPYFGMSNQSLPTSRTLDITFYSSLLFITNSLAALYMGYYTYSLVFFILFTTSIVYRLSYSYTTKMVDILCVYPVVLYGGYMLYNKYKKFNTLFTAIIVLTFLTTIYLYQYGYMTESFSFDKDYDVSNRYHALLHFIGSVGHHMIILG